MRRWLRISSVLDLLTVPLVVLALYFGLVHAPAGRLGLGGDVQRVFYFHVPFALAAFLGFALVLVSSIAFLARGSRQWDTVAEAAAEIGLLCCTVVLLTGPVWARYAWGAWWTWEARLTSTLVLWMIYAGYHLLRSNMAGDPRARRYAAVLGIVGALNVPIVYFSVRWLRGHHPAESSIADPAMALAFRLGLAAVFAMFLALLVKRLLIGQLEAKLEAVRAEGSQED